MSPKGGKETFLIENQKFTELESENESKPVGKLDDIDVTVDEIWLLQCPKGMDVKEMENQKLKIPGRTNLSDTEAVSVEFVEGVEQHAFAYCNRKGRYAMRLLPVRGTIVLRNRIKAADPITTDRIKECCPPAKRVPMPSRIRVRHPLLGHQYAEKLELDSKITKRLQDADKLSGQMIKDSFANRVPVRSKPPVNVTPIEIKSEDDDDDDEADAVLFVSEDVVKKKKKKSKRKHSESKDTKDDESLKKKKKPKNICDDQISKDLQWLQNL